MTAKAERNKKILKLRNKDPKTWSFEALATEFNIKRQTAHEIYQREQAKVKLST